MASSFEFQNTLPNPNYKISPAGLTDFFDTGDTSYVAGQPFASYKLTLNQGSTRDRTIAGKQINRTNEYGYWNIDINYNPMTREQFEPVYRFLMQRRGSLKPFFVELPNYQGPKDSGFANIVTNFNSALVEDTPYNAGTTSMEIGVGLQWPPGDYSAGLPCPGDIFSIRSEGALEPDSIHLKAYMITRVETTLDFQEGNSPQTSQVRIHFTPGLQRKIDAAVFLDFISPKFHVVQTQDIVEYSLNTEDLYSFSVRLKEAFL